MKTKQLILSGHAPNADWAQALSLLGTRYQTVKTNGSLSVEHTAIYDGTYWGLSATDKVDAVAYSYQAPIAMRILGKWIMLPSAWTHSRTTSRHANKIRGITNAVVCNNTADYVFYDVPAGKLRETAEVLWTDGLKKAEALEAARLLLEGEEK